MLSIRPNALHLTESFLCLRTLAPTTVSGEASIALALIVVSIRARWYAVAPGAASPASSVTKVRSTREPAPCFAPALTVYKLYNFQSEHILRFNM